MKYDAILIHAFPGNDEDVLRELASSRLKKKNGWRCPKQTKRGDELWFYVKGPRSEIVARGVAQSDAVEGQDWPYEVTIGDVQLLDPTLSLLEMRKMFKTWKWLKQPRAMVYLRDEHSKQLDAFRSRLKRSKQ